MPSPDYRPDYAPRPEFLDKMTGAQPANLSAEIAGLRADIKALREALVPVPSLIVLGKEALDEYRRLRA